MKETMNNEMELDMNELEQVNGGDTLCILWGVQARSMPGAGMDGCFGEGGSLYAGFYGNGQVDTKGYGGAACVLAIFGIGIGINWQ